MDNKIPKGRYLNSEEIQLARGYVNVIEKETNRLSALNKDLIAALEKLVDRDHTFLEGKVITGITYDDIQFARDALKKAAGGNDA